MDKYTVDLDKVLNDFEYSELTEQSNGFSQSNFSKPQKNYPDNSQSYSKTPVATVKHSINNVFHSLNEYLNSDIKTDLNTAGCSLSEINEIETNVPTLVRKSDTSDIASIQEIFNSISKDQPDVRIVNNNLDLEDTKFVNNNVESKNLNAPEDPKLLVDDSVDKNVEVCLTDDKLEKTIIQPIKFGEIDLSDTEMENELEELEQEFVKDNKQEEKDLKSELEEISGNESNSVIGKTDVNKTIECRIYSEANEIQETDENHEIIAKQETVENHETFVKHKTVENLETITNQKTTKNLKKVENHKANAKQETVKNHKIITKKKPVENHETIAKQKTVENRETITKQKPTENLETVENHETIAKQETIENLETIENQQTVKNHEINENHQQTVENDETNENHQQTIENYSEIIEPQLTVDNLETVECDNQQVSNEENHEIIEETQDSRQENENLSETVEEILLTEEEQKNDELEEQLKIERRGSIRPSSLDLNSESTSENLTINLIGEPGSTPYNNLYSSLPQTTDPATPIIPPTTLPSTDPDPEVSATSLSPTLSDASTYDNSQSDSANTSDSCNDTSLDEHEVGEGAERNSSGELVGERSGGDGAAEGSEEGGSSREVSWLGKTAPFWTPDSDALCCLHCNQKFTVIKRRHHCRACGLVLCSKCCNMKCKLQYMDNAEARVCLKCHELLTQADTTLSDATATTAVSDASSGGTTRRVLRPGNPMDYCSTVPPHQQVPTTAAPPPAVLVPVGVLKRQGSGKSRSSKSVMFCDGIRPGCDLAELDRDFDYKGPDSAAGTPTVSTPAIVTPVTAPATPPAATSASSGGKKQAGMGRVNRNLPKVDSATGSFIPRDGAQLPPVVSVVKSDIFYADCSNNNSIVEMLKNETITFAIQRNFHVQLRIINMECCINKQAWCFSTEGMIAVGQDEIVILLEFIDNEKYVPKDVFLHLNNIYNDAVKGTSIPEMGISIHPTSNFLESKNHAGFLYIKPTFQCIQNMVLPKEPYLIGILIHRWETPWAKIFPLRLLLRLGAEYRYYPSPIISTRHRESVYVEIGHTIINLLADFRNFTYTLPSIRGLVIHMEDKNTVVSIPSNRYDQVMKALNNSSDHILAFAANFSPAADSHLVCIQDTQGNNENAYTTHAINIHNKPRKVTGASFIVLNGALKSSSGLTAKSSIVEDGLMIQIPADLMQKLRTALRNMKDFKILCGPVNAASDESVSLVWVENDVNFNVGVTSPIDGMVLGGIPSIRVHNGRDFVCNSGNKMIRWTEVFIIQSGEEVVRTTAEPVDVSRVSEAISKATSQALVKYLDLLATNSQAKIAIRVTLSLENVSYLAGSNGTKLPPIYMKSLDNELVPVLHRVSAGFADGITVSLELMFHILNC